MTERHKENGQPESEVINARLFNMGLTILIAISIVGFFVGTHGSGNVNSDLASTTGHQDHHYVAGNQVPTAVRYSELPQAKIKPNSSWGSYLNTLPGLEVQLKPVKQSKTEQEQIRAKRSQRRAYDGAPPVVPHTIDQQHVNACLACHENGKQIGDLVAPAMSHQFYSNCTQCHVESKNAVIPLKDQAKIINKFSGLSQPVQGTRAWIGAPPTIPHKTFMRENCNSCHGPSGTAPIHTSHPWRNQCTQCHGPDANLNQTDFLKRLSTFPDKGGNK